MRDHPFWKTICIPLIFPLYLVASASCASSVEFDGPAECIPIVGSMTAWRIVAVGGANDGGWELTLLLLDDAVRDYVENGRDSYAGVEGLLRVEYVGPRGIDAPSGSSTTTTDVVIAFGPPTTTTAEVVVAARNAGEDAPGPPAGLTASLASLLVVIVVAAATYAALRRRGGRRGSGGAGSAREGGGRSVGSIGAGAPEKAMPRLIDDEDPTTPAATTMSLSIDQPADALLLPPACARSDGGTLAQSVASAGSTKSDLVLEEDVAPSPSAEPPILKRDDECSLTHALLLPPAYARSDYDTVDVEEGRRDDDDEDGGTLAQFASASGKSNLVRGEDVSPLPSAEPPILARYDECSPTTDSPPAAGEEARRREASTAPSIEHPSYPPSPGDWVPDSRGPSFDDDNVAPMSPMSARMSSIGSSDGGNFSELDTGGISFSFDDDVAQSSSAREDEENDPDRMKGNGSPEVIVARDTARPVSGAWV